MSLKATHYRQKRLALTSLIDVIFLLLMYFMLSTTFTRFGEVRLMTAAQGSAVPSFDAPRFVQLSPSGLALNGQVVSLEQLQLALADQDGVVLVALKGHVTAEALAGLLSALEEQGGLDIRVLEA